MKCALEVKEIRTAANNQHEAEENAKAMIAFVEACNNVVSLCDNEIEQWLIKEAEDYGNVDVEISFPVSFSEDRFGNKIFKRIVERTNYYADGSSSWGTYEDLKYSYDAFVRYLNDHCYKVSIKENGFSGRCYGSGTLYRDVIIVSTEPTCE